MRTVLNDAMLARQNRRFRGSGGRSEENRHAGFLPAFQDVATRAVYRARFADGRPAPCHILDGLPDEVVVRRDRAGRVAAVKASVVAGFVRDGRFYTREEAIVAVIA